MTPVHVVPAKNSKSVMGNRNKNTSGNHEKYIRRCIKLAELALNAGELPFGSVIVKNGKIIAEARQKVKSIKDITRHAEILALLKAQKLLTPKELEKCILYSNVEPCPMCSFAIRELKLKKVVFAMPSPVMGGYTKFHVLQDEGLYTKLPKYFGKPPVIIGGILEKEASKTWERREKMKKLGIKYKKLYER